MITTVKPVRLINIYVLKIIRLFIFIGCVFAILTANPFESIAALLVLLILINLFYRASHPPVLLFGLLMQWLTITIKVFYGNFLGIDFTEVFSYYTSGQHMQQAYYLSLSGLLVFSTGLWWVFKKISLSEPEEVDQVFARYNLRNLIIFFILFALLVDVAFALRWVYPGLMQGITALSRFKWGFFFVLFYLSHKQDRFTNIIYIIIAFEFLKGFTGFFAGFKEILFLTLIGIISINVQWKARTILLASILSSVIIFVFLTWSAIKSEYRYYVSGGERVQVVRVSDKEALNKIWELTTNLDAQDYEEIIEPMIDRIGYIDFFSVTLGYVPYVQHHEGGQVWMNAISHIFKPRIFFPNKPILDESEHTNKYTGLFLAGFGQGTSHSLGYIADSYVDFGPYLMFIPLFLFGIFFGLIYRNLFTRSYNIFWGTILIIPFYELTNINGMSAIKAFNFVIMYFIVAWIFRKFILRKLDLFLTK